MMTIEAVPLTRDAFAPFGDVITAPQDYGRVYASDRLANGRPGAQPSLSAVFVPGVTSSVIDAVKMERHAFSSQSFLPFDVSRYLVVVAPHAAAGGPDTAKAQAFIAGAGQGITYGMDVWHHPLVALDRPARFAIYMWLEKPDTDEEFVDLALPFKIKIPAG